MLISDPEGIRKVITVPLKVEAPLTKSRIEAAIDAACRLLWADYRLELTEVALEPKALAAYRKALGLGSSGLAVTIREVGLHVLAVRDDYHRIRDAAGGEIKLWPLDLLTVTQRGSEPTEINEVMDRVLAAYGKVRR